MSVPFLYSVGRNALEIISVKSTGANNSFKGRVRIFASL